MTDKEYKAQRKRIRTLFKKWTVMRGLRDWQVTVVYHREKFDGESTYAPKAMKGIWQCPMTTTCDPNYLTATIDAWLPVCADLDDEELEETFVHELMHVYLSPLHVTNKDGREERVATVLARAMIGLAEK